jgi:hypothetical protein
MVVAPEFAFYCKKGTKRSATQETEKLVKIFNRKRETLNFSGDKLEFTFPNKKVCFT